MIDRPTAERKPRPNRLDRADSRLKKPIMERNITYTPNEHDLHLTEPLPVA
jgi:hypothetical protein